MESVLGLIIFMKWLKDYVNFFLCMSVLVLLSIDIWIQNNLFKKKRYPKDLLTSVSENRHLNLTRPQSSFESVLSRLLNTERIMHKRRLGTSQHLNGEMRCRQENHKYSKLNISQPNISQCNIVNICPVTCSLSNGVGY